MIKDLLLPLILFLSLFNFFILNKIYDYSVVLSLILSSNCFFIITFYLFLFSSDFLSFQYKYRSYNSKNKYFRKYLPTHYFVAKTYGIKSKNRYKSQLSFSISSFCSSKRSSTNKLLINICLFNAFFLILTILKIYESKLITNEIKLISLLISPIGLILIGNAESINHKWSIFHYIGVITFMIGTLIFKLLFHINYLYIFIPIISMIVFTLLNIYLSKSFKDKKDNLNGKIFSVLMITFEILIFIIELLIIYLNF